MPSDMEHYRDYLTIRMRSFGVPEHLHDGLAHYLVGRIKAGRFLHAALMNDLSEASCVADEHSLRGLRALMQFIRTYAPERAWGSREKVEQWLRAVDPVPGVEQEWGEPKP
jgi:hypothetical protein